MENERKKIVVGERDGGEKQRSESDGAAHSTVTDCSSADNNIESLQLSIIERVSAS